MNEAEVRRIWEVLHQDRRAAYAGSPYMLHWFASRPDGKGRMGDFALSANELVKAAAAAERQEMNFYLQLNPSLKRDGVRSTAADITHWNYFLLDVDPGKDAEPFLAMDEYLRFFQHRLGIKADPHIVFSGRGVQAWVPFETPVPTTLKMDLVKTVNKTKVPVPVTLGAIVNRVQGYWLRLALERVGTVHGCVLDPAVADLPRVMRCPGTVNVKSGKMAELIRVGRPKPGYSELLVRYAPTEQVEPPPPPTVLAGKPWTYYVKLLNWSANRYLTHGGEQGDRHNQAVKALKNLHELGCEEAQARAALAWGNKLSSPEPLPQEEIEQIVRSVYKKGVVVV